MSVHLYATCWNEEKIVPFFLRHYEPLVDRIFIYDDSSTDRSVELLRASPKVEVRPLLRRTESYLVAHLALFENCWRESRGKADWVCLADLDEFVYHPDWCSYLDAQKEAGVTVIQAVGFDMISESFPEPTADLATSLTCGVRNIQMDKTPLFDPVAIEQMNHIVGRHRCTPVGRVKLPQSYRMQLRHYKALGLDYILTRSHALAGRFSEEDLARGWGLHNIRDDEAIRVQFQEQLDAARFVAPPKPAKASGIRC
ncbi:MAG TPA: glycosyltransferase family 2 protein [Verrucomicrobiae bacterium]|nr:glycosyltransferase family 2 protein [Verrucomicrobiae bacterium]